MIYVKSNNSITIFNPDNGIPYTISEGHPNWNKVYYLDLDGATFDEVVPLFSLEQKVQEWFSDDKRIVVRDGHVIDATTNEPLHGVVVDKILDMIDEGRNPQALVNFLDNLLMNTSKRAVDNLYRFLEHNRIAWTEDGYFLVYKRVRGDYRDVYSGRFDNTPGKYVWVPRNQVDEDPDRTCSQGLHVCSWDYLRHYRGDKVVVCKVDPASVVAVPKDYNNAKMRVCAYRVVGDVTDQWEAEDVLAKSSIISEYDDSDFDDEYFYNTDYNEGWW